jgi:hypothetical protein
MERPILFIQKKRTERKSWYENERKYQFEVPVSLDTVLDRLVKAFSSEITSSPKNFFTPTISLVGYIHNYTFKIFYKSYGGGGRGFKCVIYGSIKGNSEACLVTIILRDLFYLAVIIAPLVVLLVSSDDKVLNFFVAIFFIVFLKVGLGLQQVYAANQVISLLKNIINNFSHTKLT